MRDPVDRLIRAVSRRDSFALIWVQFGGAHLVLLGGMVLFRLFVRMNADQFWLLVGVSQGLCLLDNAVGIRLTRRMWRPVRAWEAGDRSPDATVAAWTALVALPLRYFRRSPMLPLMFSYLPFIAFAAWRLGIGITGFLILALVGTTVIACAVVVRYFLLDIVGRPVIERVAELLPEDFEARRSGPAVGWRLFLALPVINIVTSLIVAGLSSEGHPGTLGHLGVQWAIAVVVSLTLSLELVLLVVRTLGTTLGDLRQAVERVQVGDFSAHVPVVSTDEAGMLAQSFNRMMEGLNERETLMKAFSAYVDPGLAERVLREGNALEGQEREVSMLFLDIREFTSFSESARPRDVMALLNEFWDLVVPVLLKWGGHANKFIGDGLLGVFGAPADLADHALAATSAALEIADLVTARYGGTINVGIGVNTGAVIAGTVGGGGRVEFTVIGDAVNTASRVEEATRVTGDTILITEATRLELPAGRFRFEPRGSAELKGKSVPVQVWHVERVIRARRLHGGADGTPEVSGADGATSAGTEDGSGR